MTYQELVGSLAYYSKVHLGRDEIDEIYVRNLLLNKFNLNHYEYPVIDYELIDGLETPDYLINKFYELNGEVDLFKAVEIMGILTPSNKEVINNFNELYKVSSITALNYLYDLQIKNYYIQKTSIDKNIKWDYKDENNYIEVTINLSKPEKDNKDVAKLITQKQEDKYPACLLCIDNIGYAGNSNHPARQNIRIIPFKLKDEDFFMQYSPYCYYYHHCIVINKKHTPMKISKNTFNHLVDFVDIFSDYFIGSNSDLPIVGGSILNHEHYQGGLHTLPIMKAKTRFEIKSNNDELKIEYLNWYNSCIKLTSKNKELLVNSMEVIRNSWQNYSNESLDIINYTNNTRHNAITPIVRKDNDTYSAYIILRNNRTNDEHPDGIFHAHKEYHNIKKEGIGLIEAMGLFILPGRLKNECLEIENTLLNKVDESYFINNPNMKNHIGFINYIKKQYKDINESNVKDIITNEINNTCINILKNTAVFKDTELGNTAAYEFITNLHL